jgi:hypothetical protein
MGFIASPTSLLLAYANPSPGLKRSLLATSSRGPACLATPRSTRAVWRGRDERKHSDWFEVRMAYDPEVVASDCGIFLTTVVS